MTNETKKMRITQAMNETAELLEKANKMLNDSIKCQELYGDHEEWVFIDQEKVNSLNAHMNKLTAMLAEVA